MSTCKAICWQPIRHPARGANDPCTGGFEHLLLSELSADSTILGFDEQGEAFRLTYHLRWDELWHLRDARLVRTNAAGVIALHLDSDGRGHWRNGSGIHLDSLDGCIDIDIWPTPFTNTFPIRRARLAIGQRQEFTMAYVDAGTGPGISFRAMRQGYTRLGPLLYRYENLDGSGFSAELPVDDDDVVRDYQGLFRRLI